MAIYHLSAGFVSRSTGRSSVQSAAYISGALLHETRRDIKADYRNRSLDVIFATTLAIDAAPAWAKELGVWDRLESYEDEYAGLRYKTDESQTWYKEHAQTSQTLVVALPKELDPPVWQELVCIFALERFISRGLVVSIAIHKEEGNPHAHLQISRRAIDENGAWAWAKDRAITTKAALIDTRKLWAEKVNFYLEREGFNERVTHQSYLDLGLPIEATRHEGWFAHKLEGMGKTSRIINENEDIKDRNKERLALDPAAILQELTTKNATFSAMDLARAIQGRVRDDAKLTAIVYESAIQQAILVGSSLDGQARYTSQDYFDKEREALQWATHLSGQLSEITLAESETQGLIAGTFAYLNSEQQVAVAKLCQDKKLGVMIGRAGTGKTTTLKAVVACHQNTGFKVFGLALSAVAAENLKTEAQVEAETIAFYLDKWSRLEVVQQQFWSLHPSSEHPALVQKLERLSEYELSKNHLVIVDEAGMVGTTQWHQLLYFIQRSGAKLIAAGDDHQFKAIEAGDFFRKLTQMCPEQVCQLQNIQRQKVAWMQNASRLLAELKTYEALASFENHGCIEQIDSLTTIAQAYIGRLQQNPEQTGLLLAATNAQCTELNNEVRLILKEQGLIARQEVRLSQGAFAVNDRITFLSNDRLGKISTYDPSNNAAKEFLIKNGTKGRILAIEASGARKSQFKFKVEIEPQLHAKFLVADYNDFKHGYALTLHKAQGQTVDWSYILASCNMDAFASYVALTRHRFDVKIFYQEKDFADFKTLQGVLGRVSYKDLVVDYSIDAEHQLAWENVQEYKLLGQDLAATVVETNWEGYRALKLARDEIGKIILEEWDVHQNFAKQAGLSFESIAINCGLKMRPLSMAEIAARETVALYADKALNARLIWRVITRTHPGRNCYKHPRYEEFTQLRLERNALAQSIVAHQALHKPFVQEMAHLGVGWKTLRAQAQQGQFSAFTGSQGSADDKSTGGDASGTGNLGMRAAKPGSHPSPPYDMLQAQVNGELSQRIGLLATQLLGEPASTDVREWRYANSIAIQVNGLRQGLYADFAAGSYGGPLKLIQEKLALDESLAYKWALEWLGDKGLSKPYVEMPIKVITGGKENIWSPIFPVPKTQQLPNLTQERSLAYLLNDKNLLEIERYSYHDLQDNLLGFTVRLRDAKDCDIVLPLTYCQNQIGAREWRWQGFGQDRPLYGLQYLGRQIERHVLVVEGENTADAARNIFTDMNVVTWSGGSPAVLKTNWSPLLAKQISLWPDNYHAGTHAMQELYTHLTAMHYNQMLQPLVQTINLPPNTPDKWNLAHSLPEEWDSDTLQALLPDVAREASSPLTKDFVKELAQKYELDQKDFHLDEAFLSDASNLYQEMIAWHKLLEAPPSQGVRECLMERAVLTQALLEPAKEHFYFSLPPLAAQVHGTDLALMSANAMQRRIGEAGQTMSYFKAGLQYLDTRDSKREKLIEEYSAKYSEASKEQVLLLAKLYGICRAQINLSLTEFAAELVLKAAKAYELLKEQGQIAQTVDKILQSEISINTHESAESIEALLERQCMQQLLSYPEQMVENYQKSLAAATNIVQHKQIALEQRAQNVVLTELSLTTGYVKELGLKYNIDTKDCLLDEYFFKEVKQLHQEMLGWHNIQSNYCSIKEQQHLMEKATLTQLLLEPTQNKYCLASPHLLARERGRDIALIATNILQNNVSKPPKMLDCLKVSNRILEEQRDVTNKHLIEHYQEIYNHASQQQLQLLANQHQACKSQTGLVLNEGAQQKVLVGAQRFETLSQQGVVTKAIQNIVENQRRCSLKETVHSVGVALERQCMKQMIMQPSMKIDQGQKTLDLATKSIKESQINIERQLQKSIELLMQGRGLSKDLERER